jgi:two-component system NtrC family response regulator
MNNYDWPGNIRELENRVKRAVIMTESLTIEPADLGFTAESDTDEPSIVGSGQDFNLSGMKLKEARSMVEKQLVTETMAAAEGNVLKAAEALGVSRPTLYDLMKKHGLYVEETEG